MAGGLRGDCVFVGSGAGWSCGRVHTLQRQRVCRSLSDAAAGTRGVRNPPWTLRFQRSSPVFGTAMGCRRGRTVRGEKCHAGTSLPRRSVTPACNPSSSSCWSLVSEHIIRSLEMSDEIIAGLIGGLAGGIAGAVGSWVTGYWGPLKLEERREHRQEERIWAPRKALLRELLDKADPAIGRSFATLKRVTGTSDDELRRLLVEMGARGFSRPNGDEAWVYKRHRPLEQQGITNTPPASGPALP